MQDDPNMDVTADESPYIFTGTIKRVGATTMPMLPTGPATVVVAAEEVMRAPIGMPDFAGSEVTVELLKPLPSGRYVFFADPWAVGGGLAVRERAHHDATSLSARGEVVAAMEQGFAGRMTKRTSSAILVVLGRIGEVQPVTASDEREEGTPWALASLEIEQLLKGDGNPRRVELIGPRFASKWMPRTPVLRPGLRAIFVLHPPPKEAADAVRESGRAGLLFIEESSDILPPERLKTMDQIAKSGR